MGTRNLTIVKSNRQTKIAQYGQWDGHPSGQGKTVLSFLKNANLKTFKKKVDKLYWLTDEEKIELDKLKDVFAVHPHLSRDCGAKILDAVMYGKVEVYKGYNERATVEVNVTGLVNEEAFLKDGLFCKWAYEIDLDNNTLSVYAGGTSPIKTYNIDELPEQEQFEKELESIVAGEDSEDKF